MFQFLFSLFFFVLPRLALAEEPEPPRASWGADVSVGGGVGTILNPWAVSGFHTALSGRYDTFVQARDQAGPRLGLSVFAETPLLHTQTWREPEGEGEILFTQYGAISILRFDPSLPWSGLAGIGFARLDVEDYLGARQTVPLLVFEAGARRMLGGPTSRAYADLLLRASWGTARAPEELASPWYLPEQPLADWWILGLGISAGLHAR